MEWREVDLFFAASHCCGRKILGKLECSPQFPSGAWDGDSFPIHGIAFTDGTALVCSGGKHKGSTEHTPKLEVDPPRFWIGTPKPT